MTFMDTGKKLLHQARRGSRPVLSSRMAGQSRDLPAAGCVAVDSWSSDTWSRYCRRAKVQKTLQGYALLAMKHLFNRTEVSK